MATTTQSNFYLPFVNVSSDLQINYNPTNWNSLFIPSLPPQLVDDELLSYIIEEIFLLGQVKRVDIIKKENSNNRLMAFIHFDFWYKNNSVDTFREKIENEGQVNVYGFINKDKIETNYSDFISNIKKGVFIRFMINNNPIKDTELNIHQIADLLEKADKKITEQDLMIENLTKELEEARSKIVVFENQNRHQIVEEEWQKLMENEWNQHLKLIDFDILMNNEDMDLVNVVLDEFDDSLNNEDLDLDVVSQKEKEFETITRPILTRENYIY